MLRPLLITFLLCAGCASAPTATPTTGAPAPPRASQTEDQQEPILAALESLEPRLGTVTYEAVSSLLMVNGFTNEVMIHQDQVVTVVVHGVNEYVFTGDVVVCVYSTGSRVLLEANLLRYETGIVVKGEGDE